MPYYLVPAETLDLARDTYAEDLTREYWRLSTYDRHGEYDYAEVFGEYATRAEAATAARHLPRGTKTKIVFVPTETQHAEWWQRERDRLQSGAYVPAPWNREPWFRYHGPTSQHYGHLSTAFPELVAYTPDAEYGIADRQIRTTPGRYLDKFFARVIDTETRDRMIACVKAYDGKYHVATTAIEIVAVYRHGPDSCMSHAVEDYDDGCDGRHPVEAYGDSDLAVAYMGHTEDKAVTSRTIIWAAKKRYGRVYGQNTGPALVAALRADGYRCAYGGHDGPDGEALSFHGARLKAIDVSGGLLIPYVDGHHSADRRGEWLTLRAPDDHRGAYDAQLTAGCGREASQCAECGTTHSNDGDYCDDCRGPVCAGCDQRMSPGYDMTVINGDDYCDECASERAESCELCSETFYPNNLTSRQQENRRRAHLSALCPDCASSNTWCAECDTYYDTDHCEDCAENGDDDTNDGSDDVTDNGPAVVAASETPAVTEPIAVPFVDVPGPAGAERGLLRDAIAGGRWIRPTVARTCSIASCREPIAAGELAFQGDASARHLTYCVECMAGYQCRMPHSARPDVPLRITRTALPGCTPCNYADCHACWTFTVEDDSAPATAPESEVSHV